MMLSCARVEEWPTIEALEKRAKFEYEELEAYRYVESKTYLVLVNPLLNIVKDET